jgi:FAD synthetase
MKELLKILWKLQAGKVWADREALVERFGEKMLEKVAKEGLIESDGNRLRLTGRGRERLKIVACGGVFDILHPGHGFFLERAKSYGDLLVVIVALDSTVEKRKRIPIVPEEQRREMVGYLKPVDHAVLGGEGDFLKIIEALRPDVIVLGPDQRHDEEYLQGELKKRGVRGVKVKRVYEYKKCPLHSTKSLLGKIIDRGYPK